MKSREAFHVYECHGLTPTARLVGMRATGAAIPQENGEHIAVVMVHTLQNWLGCGRVQLMAALEELKKQDIVKEWRHVEVADKSGMYPEGRTFEALLLFVQTQDDDYLADDDRDEVSVADVIDEDAVTKIDPRRERIFEKTGGKCFYCVEASAEHLDHMHPASRGGSSADENMIGACATCNVQKNDRTVDEYRAYLAYKRKLPSVAEIAFYGERRETAA